ncbi:ABC transporter permease, partial [Staphylococcus aureus]|nr:ABC transporter permease [Staphylococcus aureus]
MINKILLSLKMQFRVPISVFFSLIFPIIMIIVIILSYGNFSIGNGRHFIDKYFLISTSIGLLP